MLIISLGAIVYFFSSKESTKTNQNKETTVERDATSTPPFSLIDKTSFLQHSGNSSCEKVAQDEQAACYKALELAMNSTSTIACDGLADKDDQLICAKNSFIKQAISEGKIDKCDEFVNDSDRTSCAGQVYFNLAIWRRDPAYCKKILSETDRQSCLATVEGGVK